jgi:hypothetical protein
MISLPLAALGDFLGIIIFIIVAVVSALSKRNQTDDTHEAPPLPRQQPPSDDLSDEMRRFLEQARKASQPKSTPPPILPSTPPPMPAPQRPKTPSHQGYQKKIVRHEPVVQQVKRVFVKEEKALTPKIEKIDLLKEMQVDVPEKVHVEPPPPLPEEQAVDVNYKAEVARTSTPTPAKVSTTYFRSPANVRQAILFMEVLGKPRAVSPYQGPE